MYSTFNSETNSSMSEIGEFFFTSSGVSPEESVERIKVMRRQEESFLCTDYLSGCDEAMQCGNGTSQTSLRPVVDIGCRTKMCEWCFQIADFCKYQRESVGVGMHYLDRFLCSGSETANMALLDRKVYQLAAMTAFYIAVKLFEPSQIEVKTLSELSRGCYSEEEIIQMETQILVALSWRMHNPSSVAFVRHYLSLLPSQRSQNKVALQLMLDVSLYQTELAVGEYDLVSARPSIVAFASISNAMSVLGTRYFPEAEQALFHEIVSSASEMDHLSVEFTGIKNYLAMCLSKNASEEMILAVNQVNAIYQHNVPHTSPICVSSSCIQERQQC